MKPVEPLYLLDLMYELNLELLDLLRELSMEQWHTVTACDPWTVQDLVAHLLGSDIGRLAGRRDGQSLFADETINSYDDLLALIDRNNAEWVNAMRRLSPPLLIAFLALTNQQLYDYWRTVDPHSMTPIGVAWAGEMESREWFDAAREYTEKWMHQQQIREAVGAPSIISHRWMFPTLDTFMRGLPHAYRAVTAPDGTIVTVEITGNAGGTWSLQRVNGVWQLFHGTTSAAMTYITLDQDTAWRLFTNGLAADQAVINVAGNAAYGNAIRRMIAIMA